MKKIIIGIICLVVILIQEKSKAQDIHFSQYYLTPVYFNPAYSGALKDMDISLQYKGQWNMIDKGYRTYAFSASSRINYKKTKHNFWAVGINAFADQAGTQKMNTVRINVPLSFTVKLDQLNTISNAVVAGYGQNTLKDPSFTWGSQYDGMNYNSALPTNEINYAQNFSFLDLGYGLSWNYNHETRTVSDVRGVSNTLGFSVSHINRPSYSFSETDNDRLAMKFILYESASISMKNSKISWQPSFLYQLQGGHRELIFGTMCRYEIQQESRFTGFREGSAISAGVYRRSKDAFVFSALYEINHLQVGMSYDMNTSELNNSTSYRGGFEVCIKFITPSPFRMGGRAIL